MASPDYKQLVKNTMLSACIRDNINVNEKRKKIEAMIVEGADVNFKDANDNRNTALHIAVTLEELEIVTLLLYRGANVLNQNSDGVTPLDLAKNLQSALGQEIETALIAKLKFQEELESHNKIKTCTETVNKKGEENPLTETTTIDRTKQFSYIKRSGTSGVTGQLYETKILSLVMLKASTDQNIQNFYLGTNINGIGAFDDLCFRYKHNSCEKDVLVVLQAKHRDDPETRKLTINDIRSITGDFALPKYLESYLKIKARFNNKHEDPMFAGDFSDVECNCILYTPSKDMLDDSYKSFDKENSKVKKLINTCITDDHSKYIENKDIFQFKYSDVDIESLSKFMVEDNIKNLGVTLMDFIINNGKFNNMLTDELIRTYHVVLAQTVIDVSCKAPSGMFRNGRFRPDFFHTNEIYTTILRESCYRELVTTHAKTLKLRKKEAKKLLQQILDTPSSSTLSKLFGTLITYNEKLNKLELIEENLKAFKHDEIKQFREYLRNIYFNESMLNEAIEIICKEELVKKEFKLPNSFGNFDMTIRSSGKKENKKIAVLGECSKKSKTEIYDDTTELNIPKYLEQQNIVEDSLKPDINAKISNVKDSKQYITDQKDKFNQRLDHLANKFRILFEKFQATKVIEIDYNLVGHEKLLEEGFLDINGGIGGAVGNLFIGDIATGYLKFDPCCTADTACKFLEKLKNKLPIKIRLENQEINNSDKLNYEEKNKIEKEEITSYYLNIKTDAFPRLSFYPNENDKLVTKNFLESLWFYTNQAKENRVESILKNEIDKQYNVGRVDNQFRIHSDAIFLKFHDEIQKWWMSFGQVPYLTKERNIFEEINQHVIENPLLTILNAMYLNKLKKIGVEYNAKCVQRLKLESYSEKIINIVTEVNTLTGVKLMQLLNNQNCIFIDFDYVLSLPKLDFNQMLSELKLTKRNTLIIVYEIPNRMYGLDEKLILVMNNFKILEGSKIIIVTNNILAKEIEIRYSNEYIAINDNDINLNDLTNKSQNKVFTETKITFQDQEIDLSFIIDRHNKHLVKRKILWKLINNEKLEIGRKIKVITYNNNDKNIDGSTRTLKLTETHEVDSLYDIEEKVVVIISKPGMGKSILLKHLALETKKESPHIWIPVINFSDCNDFFCSWQNKRMEITVEEKFKLLCKVILKNDVISQMKFKVETEENKVKITSFEDMDPLALFELEMFLEFYNNGKVIFLFDDFDDICPPYKKEVLALLTTLELNNRLWITCRSYPIPKSVLEQQFGQCYTLMPLERAGQMSFLHRFFKTNINLEKLNNEQFSNCSDFLKHIAKRLDSKTSRQLVPFVSIPLHLIYIFAIDFFKSEINHINSSVIKNTLKDRLNVDMDSWGTLRSLTDEFSSEIEEVMELAGTPLYLYIAANYFTLQLNESVKVIFDKNEFISKWDIITNAVQLYKQFLEDTLKGVCFKKSIVNIDVEETEQVELRREFLERHKKLLLLAVCKENDLNKLLKENEINELKETIASIQNGENRSGAIECILDDVPRFFHLIFAEYFIIEVLVDLLKKATSNEDVNLTKHKAIWDFIINIVLYNAPMEVRKVFNYKLKHDPDLRQMTCKDYCRDIVFELLLKQNDTSSNISNDSRKYTLRLAIADGLTFLTEFLINCIKDKLNRDNIKKFVNMLKDSKVLETSLGPEKKVFIDTILNIMKGVGVEKLFEIVNSDAFVDTPVQLVSLTGDENVVANVRSNLTLARQQFTEASGQVLSITRDTTNLLTGVIRVLMDELRK